MREGSVENYIRLEALVAYISLIDKQVSKQMHKCSTSLSFVSV